jgi:hypothetical protein
MTTWYIIVLEAGLLSINYHLKCHLKITQFASKQQVVAISDSFERTQHTRAPDTTNSSIACCQTRLVTTVKEL